VGVKDIFHVDGFPTHAGSKLPAQDLAGEQAATVTQLKQAGALVFGKTVTTEFAYFGPGPTRNPRNLEHTPGGSSSGSAAAVAAGMVPAALGTQTIGSIIRPAAFCGVVGYKPTSGRLSTQGVIPLSPTLDHVGLFAPKAARMHWLASQLVDGWAARAPLAKPVLGIPVGPYMNSTSAEGLAAFEAAQGKLTEAGYEARGVETSIGPDSAHAREQNRPLDQPFCSGDSSKGIGKHRGSGDESSVDSVWISLSHAA
jgi:Asp-tRNA(Asn)/Glu-tRNA(Gln) amidotransferase A subunit family amidase